MGTSPRWKRCPEVRSGAILADDQLGRLNLKGVAEVKTGKILPVAAFGLSGRHRRQSAVIRLS